MSVVINLDESLTTDDYDDLLDEWLFDVEDDYAGHLAIMNAGASLLDSFSDEKQETVVSSTKAVFTTLTASATKITDYGA